MEKIGFQHPELQEGEAYADHIFPSSFERVGWKTKRLGVVAYDKLTGKPLPENLNRRPLFVQRAEMIAVGVNPDINIDLIIKAILDAHGN